MGSSASELTLDRGRSHGGWRFLSGFKSFGFPSKWTGRHVTSMSLQARMRCLVSRLSFLISQVFLRMRTVTKVKFRPLIHRLSSSVLPPPGEHTQHLLFVLVAEEGLRGPLAEVVQTSAVLPDWKWRIVSKAQNDRIWRIIIISDNQGCSGR